MRSLASIGCVALCWAAACGDESEAPPLELELGSGEVDFEPASDGDELQLYAGTQGGHHVWLSMRVRGVSGPDLLFSLDVVPSEPAPPAHTEVSLHFDAAPALGEGWYQYVGWPARVLMPECAVGQPVQLAVTLRDAAGRSMQAELEVIPGAPQHPFSVPCVP